MVKSKNCKNNTGNTYIWVKINCSRITEVHVHVNILYKIDLVLISLTLVQLSIKIKWFKLPAVVNNVQFLMHNL